MMQLSKAGQPLDLVADVPHKWKVGAAGCRFLFIWTPGGGVESLIREMSEPAGSRTLPPRSDEEPDWERVAAVVEARGCELLV